MTEQSPTVTVIIPTYNSSATLALAVATVLQQDHRDFELRVIGDGCTDDSETVMNAFNDGRVHWMNLPSNSGAPSHPRNEGIHLARGRYIAYLGHDDLWLPWHLSNLIKCLETTGSEFAYSLGAVIGQEGLRDTFTVPERPWLWRTHLSPGSWLHRRTLVDKIGPWSTRVKIGHDVDFLQRVLDKNLAMTFSPHLSVLTFPAGNWRIYSSEIVPQKAYLEAIQQDAEGLQLRLMTEAAGLLAREGRMGRCSGAGLPAPLASLVRWGCDRYGRYRWPLNQILYRMYRRRTGMRRSQADDGH
jgi:glycosyltransferase involved in cell wall biosynthesis